MELTAPSESEELQRLRSENRTLRAALSALALAPSAAASAPAAPRAAAPPAAAAAPAAPGVASSPPGAVAWRDPCGHGLSAPQLERYARHVALPAFGVRAQGALTRARVLVVGAGGLGSAAALYLAAAGVGHLSIADSDVVEASNLHRQVIHDEAWIGKSKAASAAAACRALNSLICVEELPAVTPASAAAAAAAHDCVVDCTDNAASRYMLSDAAVAARVPLVSGAAVGTEGQVSVLCGGVDAASGARAAPCYRCLYRSPAPPSACARCADAGVLGPVPGVIGTLQAVEALKVLSGTGVPLRGTLLLYDALSARPFLATQLAPPDAACPACGAQPDAALSAERLASFDYAAFVAGPAASSSTPPPPPPPPPPPRVTCRAYVDVAAAGGAHLLLDVRPTHLYDVAALQGAHSLPFTTATQFAADFAARFPQHAPGGSAAGERVFLLCRRGNASQKAAHALIAAGVTGVADVIGGVTAWRSEVDPTFPL